MARGSAEASAEASVDLAEASGFGRTQFWVVRSFTSPNTLNAYVELVLLNKYILPFYFLPIYLDIVPWG